MTPYIHIHTVNQIIYKTLESMLHLYCSFNFMYEFMNVLKCYKNMCNSSRRSYGLFVCESRSLNRIPTYGSILYLYNISIFIVFFSYYVNDSWCLPVYKWETKFYIPAFYFRNLPETFFGEFLIEKGSEDYVDQTYSRVKAQKYIDSSQNWESFSKAIYKKSQYSCSGI